MSNFVFYDFETSSSNKQWGQIIEIGAILIDDQLNELCFANESGTLLAIETETNKRFENLSR